MFPRLVCLAILLFHSESISQDDAFREIDEDHTLEVSTLIIDGGVERYERTVVRHPSHGTLSPFQNNWIVYTPHPDYWGPDGFVLRTVAIMEDDGEPVVEIQPESVYVRPDNDQPTGRPKRIVVNARDTGWFTLSGTDIEGGDSLKFVLAEFPAHGTLVSSDGKPITEENLPESGHIDSALGYVPSDSATLDSLAFYVDDGTKWSEMTWMIFDYQQPSRVFLRRAPSSRPSEMALATDVRGRVRRLPWTRSGPSGTWSPDLSSLPSGVWKVRVRTPNGEAFRSVVVK